MITAQNLSIAFNSLTKTQISEAMNSPHDYISMFISGNYEHVYLESSDYSEEENEEIQACGGVYTDKDEFLRLFKESESVNPFLIELI